MITKVVINNNGDTPILGTEPKNLLLDYYKGN